MNSRNRILAALNHQETDRVPLDVSGHRSSGIAAIAYARLRDYLALPKKPIRVYDVMQQLAVLDQDVLDMFGVDTIELGRAFAVRDEDWADWIMPNGTACQVPVWTKPEREGNAWVIRAANGKVRARMPDGSLYFDSAYYPFADDKPDHEHLQEAIDAGKWAMSTPPGPLADGPDGDANLVEGAKRLRASTDRAIIGLFGGNLLEAGAGFYRNDNFLALLAAEPAQAHDFLERLTEIHMKDLEKYIRLVGPYIDIILFGDDLGMQTGPQISPRMYREFFKPREARMWKYVKEHSNLKIMLHCCGGVRPLLADLIDAGLDTINPVQISSKGMDAADLKKDFGKDITLWGGGCDTQWVLSHGTPEQVKEHVKKQVEILRPGGGFVFQQVHNMLADVPPQNIVAMLETVNQC